MNGRPGSVYDNTLFHGMVEDHVVVQFRAERADATGWGGFTPF